MRYIGLISVLIFSVVLPVQTLAQEDSARLHDLEQRISKLERHPRGEDAAGVAAFVCAAFCALWAQQTGRNAWLWFFLGLIFNVITLLVLLYKNAGERSIQSTSVG